MLLQVTVLGIDVMSWIALVKSFTRFHGVTILCLATLAGSGFYFVLDEKAVRAELAKVPPVLREKSPSTTPVGPVSAGALLTSMGFQADGRLRQSPESATVRGLFMASNGSSTALLTVAGQDSRYRLGDRLPGGSVLQRIEPGRVLLSNRGVDTFLPLSVSGSATLVTTADPKSTALVHFKPTTAMSESQ
ncbi:type II secretion system protein N [Pseudomonas sp. RC10]|uniref:type II secretion system protein N n=1 Tax=Pseudomonas bambusae TaxID=3139142 RepID=UPI0031399A3E